MSSLLLLLKPRTFSPLQLPGLKLWLDASRITGLVDGDPVPTWVDASPSAASAAQGTGANQGLLRLGASGINNRAAVDCDGSNDFMACAGLTKTQIPTTGDVTLACVFRLDGGLGAEQNILYLGNFGVFAPNYHNVVLAKLANDTLVFNGYDGSEHRAVSDAALTTGVTYIAIGVREANVNKLYLNGVLQTTTAASGTPNISASATLHLGGPQGGTSLTLNGKMGEALAVNRALSAGEVAKLSNYWGARF